MPTSTPQIRMQEEDFQELTIITMTADFGLLLRATRLLTEIRAFDYKVPDLRFGFHEIGGF
jgi:hypothetical protein